MLRLLLCSACHSLGTMVVVILVDVVHDTWRHVTHLATQLRVPLALAVVDRVAIGCRGRLSLTIVRGINLIAGRCQELG